MTGVSVPKPGKKGAGSAFRRFVATGGGGLLIIVLVFAAIMSVASKQFLSTFNLFVLLREVSTAVLIGFSQMIVLAIGQMNLSVGSIGGLVVVITGGLMEVYQWPIWAAVLAGLSVGVLAGMLNGFLITRTGLNSFIVTIATASIFFGLNLGITQAQPFYKIPAAYNSIGQARWLFVPRMSVVTIVVIILMAIFLYRMLAGRQLLAVGGNAVAAETSGIPVKRMVVLAHAISGFLAAAAGMLWSAQLGSAQPMIGQTWLLPSFAIPIIGGVALTGGSVSLRGTVLAAFLIAIINNALVHLQVDPYYVQFLVGLLILAAVGLNRLAQRGPVSQTGGVG
jgi:ribose transport system permease protein